MQQSQEQFYIVWPLLVIAAVWVASKVGGLSRRRSIAGVLAIVFVASLAFSVYETARSQPSAYFITTTRAWEFAVGGLVAMIPMVATRGKLAHFSKDILSWGALATVLACAWIFDARTPFPGWIALIPVVATGFLLWIGDSTSTWSPQFIARSGPIQLIGDASYAIYLWHWPLILVFVVIEGRNPGWKWMIVLALTTILLGVLTKRFVEDPVRRAPGRLRERLPTFAFMAAGMAMMALLTIVPVQVMQAEDRQYSADIQKAVEDPAGCYGAYAILNNCDDPYVINDIVNPGFAAADTITNSEILTECARTQVGNRGEYSCDFGDPESSTHIVMVGDSHADQYSRVLKDLAESSGWRIEVRSRPGCASVFGVSALHFGNLPEVDRVACVDWGKRQRESLVSDPTIDAAIVSIRSALYATDEQTDMTAVVADLRAKGVPLALLGDVPGTETSWPLRDPGVAAPKCIERNGAESEQACSWVSPPRDWLAGAAEDAGAPFVDPRDLLCSQDVCRAVIGGAIVYFDDNHLTTSFSRSMAPWFEQELSKLLRP